MTPAPPEDLHRRHLPLDVLPPGTRLYRIHRCHLEPLFFGPAPGRPPTGRWDGPDGSFGVCYLADGSHPEVAFAECFLREPGRSLVPESLLRETSLATVSVRSALSVVRFHGNGLARLGATAEVAHGDHRASRPWSAALEAHPSRPHGLRWRARHDDDGFAVALYDRSGPSLEVLESQVLLSTGLIGLVADWLERYGIRLS